VTPPWLPSVADGEALYAAQYRGLQFLASRGFAPKVLPLVYPAPGGRSGDFRFLDGDGQLWAVRADFTPLAARALARELAHAQAPLRVCYAGEVARRPQARLSGVAAFFQLGFESFAVEGEAVQTVELLLELVRSLGVAGEQLQLSISHAGVAEGMLAQLLEDAPDQELLGLMVAKDTATLAERLGLVPEASTMLREALWGEGERWVRFFGLELAWERFTAIRQRAASLGVAASFEVAPPLPSGYYSGVVFSLWGKGTRSLLASGGEYAVVWELARIPAVGSTLSLDRLVEEAAC